MQCSQIIKTRFIYHPVFQDVRKILEELHVVLAFDDGNKKVFPDAPTAGFKINTNLKAHLLRSQLADLDEVGRSMWRKKTLPFMLKYETNVHF